MLRASSAISCLCPIVQAEIDRVFFGANEAAPRELELHAGVDESDGEDGERRHAEREGELHVGVLETAALAGHDGGVLAAPLLHAVVDDGQVRRAENAERGGELALAEAVARKGAEDLVGDVNEPRKKRRRETRIPGPVVAPRLRR